MSKTDRASYSIISHKTIEIVCIGGIFHNGLALPDGRAECFVIIGYVQMMKLVYLYS